MTETVLEPKIDDDDWAAAMAEQTEAQSGQAQPAPIFPQFSDAAARAGRLMTST